MSNAMIKEHFHRLIDEIENEELLRDFYQALLNTVKKEGNLYKSLSKSEKAILKASYEESKDDENIISLEEVRAKACYQ
jgi:GTP1/Obg family GTP-binding protein